MTPELRKKIIITVAILVVIALCLVFPRVFAFTQLAARELRYFWWLILIAGAGIYLSFFFGRKK